MNNFTAIRPFYKVSRFFGFLPISLEYPTKNRKLQFTKLSVLTTIFGIFLFFLIFPLVIRNHMIFKTENQSILGVMIWSWILLTIFPTILIQILIQIASVKKIQKYFESVHDIDEKIFKLGVFLKFKSQEKFVFYTTWFFIVLTMSRLAFSAHYVLTFDGLFYNTTGSILGQEFCFGFVQVYEWMFILQFVFHAYLIRERFRGLTDFIS